MRSVWLVLMCSSASPGVARAFELTGATWPLDAYPDGLPYCASINAIEADGETERAAFAAAIDGAFLAWTADGAPASGIPGVACSGLRVGATECSGAPRVGDGQPWVFWQADWGSVAGVGPSTLAVALWWSRGGQTENAQIIFNDQHFAWSTDGSANDVGAVALHEVGHVVGLAHYDARDGAKQAACAATPPPSVMCAYAGDDAGRVPTADDQLGICYLYPRAGALGAPCAAPGECDSGLCHAEGRCTVACPPSCPLGYACTAGLCVRTAPPPSCPPCATMPCGAGALCVGAAGESLCTGPCGGHGDCPLGFVCANQDDAGGVCWPAAGRCDDAGPSAGEPCAGGRACAFGHLCLTLAGGGTSCAVACRQDTDCAGVAPRCVALEPGLGYCDLGGTGCPCDTGAACQPGCTCDAACDVCPCDHLAGVCDAGCTCDLVCEPERVGGRDERGGCQASSARSGALLGLLLLVLHRPRRRRLRP